MYNIFTKHVLFQSLNLEEFTPGCPKMHVNTWGAVQKSFDIGILKPHF